MTDVVKFVVPKGRTAAEKRLSAIAALHSPRLIDHGVVGRVDLGHQVICPECSNHYGKVSWPCATARLLGPWPGEAPTS